MFELLPGMHVGSCLSPLHIVMVTAGVDGLTLAASDGNPGAPFAFPAGWCGLLVQRRVVRQVTAGRAQARVVSVAVLAKLQAFVDAGRTVASDPRPVAAFDDDLLAIAIDLPQRADLPDMKETERWFLHASSDAAPTSVAGDLGASLRTTECYQLVRFLLAQSGNTTMLDLSKQYGLSYSHFRMLCRDALGRGGKAELQQWRNVRALLDMVDSGGSLTDVALRQGFASSSHFSDAMKEQFGIAPSNLTRQLKVEK